MIMKNKITNILGLSALLISASLFTGCKTIPGGKPPEEAALNYIKPTVIIACAVSIESIEDKDKRIEVAKKIFAVSVVIESLASGQVPTPDQLSLALKNVLPNEPKYLVLVQAFRDLYANHYAQFDNNAVLAFRYLKEISSGCRDAASLYIPQN